MGRMVMVVDLHTTDVDHAGARCLGTGETRQGLIEAGARDGATIYIHRVGLEPPLPPRFVEADGIKNGERDRIARSGARDLPLAGDRLSQRTRCVALR